MDYINSTDYKWIDFVKKWDIHILKSMVLDARSVWH